MNKTKLLILSVLLLITTYVQAQFYSIDKMYLSETGREIEFYIDVNEPKYIFYDLKTNEDNKKAIARLSSSDVNYLIRSLMKAQVKYEEWSKVAAEENCRFISKRIPTPFKDQTIYFTDENKWFREMGVDMKGMLSVDAFGKCNFVLQSDDMQSEESVGEISSTGGIFVGGGKGIGGFFGSGSQMTITHYCSGASLTFKSIEEINEFIAKLQNALNWKNKNNSKKNIFK